VKLDILMAFIVIFIYNLPSLDDARLKKDLDILNLINVNGDDGIRKFYLGVLITDDIIRVILVKSVKKINLITACSLLL
jgi:hypothetical protein